MNDYKFYMQSCTPSGDPTGEVVDLEAYFKGMRYAKCQGLNAYGQPKNIYTETYADADMTRVYIPEAVMHEATQIVFTFYFFGDAETRQASFDSFVGYIKNGCHLYWDTARKKKCLLLPLTKEVKPSDEMWYSGTPYFKVEVNLVNSRGYAENVE